MLLTSFPPQPKTEKKKKQKACIEIQLFTVQVESAGGQFTLHTKHNLKKKKTPLPPRKGGPLHSMTPDFSLVARKFYS